MNNEGQPVKEKIISKEVIQDINKDNVIDKTDYVLKIKAKRK